MLVIPTTEKYKHPTFVALYIRLDKTNYSFWCLQVLTTIRAHRFENILLASSASLMVTDGSESSEMAVANLWQRRDQYLMIWLLSSISESMLGYVSHCVHSYQV